MNLEITLDTLKPVSEKLVARMTQMGLVSKTGKPIVVDQAYELVAAMVGHRNQHRLRKLLSREAACTCCTKPVAGKAEMPSDTVISMLTALGYSVAQSDFKRPYWEFGGDASEDFNTEAEAWQAAYADAKVHGRLGNTEVDSQTSMQQFIEELQQRWGNQHGHYERADWQKDVAAGDTKLGYWEWVAHNIETHGGEEEHCDDCGAVIDGDGWNGLCGNCADRASVVDNHCVECGEYEAECTCEEGAADSCVGEANAASQARDDKAADEAYEAFDFQDALGGHVTVAACNAWECCTCFKGGVLTMRKYTRTVFLENNDRPDDDSRKVRFYVEVTDGVAQNEEVKA
jgi:hypothetical protein